MHWVKQAAAYMAASTARQGTGMGALEIPLERQGH